MTIYQLKDSQVWKDSNMANKTKREDKNRNKQKGTKGVWNKCSLSKLTSFEIESSYVPLFRGQCQ